MPKSDVHKTKRKKNLAVFGAVLLVCAIIWGVTVVRISSDQPPQTQESTIE